MSALGRERNISPNQTVDTNKLQLEDILTRTTFIRMTSSQENPVILMGGELLADGTTTDSDGNLTLGSRGEFAKMAAGYEDIYGPRLFYDSNDFLQSDQLGENKLKRPMPGIKGIDVSFKGGLRTNREATINWTCWSWDDINRLTPHFLGHGNQVLLEWGWVYDKQTLQNLPSFVVPDEEHGGTIKISPSVYTNYQKIVAENNGDFDLMAGIIKNFEYTTREDGGFDCTTTLTSVGINLIEREGGDMGPATTQDPTTTYNINLKDDDKVEEFFSNVGPDKTAPEILINTNVSLKGFLSSIDKYLTDELFNAKLESQGKNIKAYLIGGDIITGENLLVRGDSNPLKQNFIYSVPNKAIVQIETTNVATTFKAVQVKDAWVRWGWFEDNILSKFLSLTEKGGRIITKFRSVERVMSPVDFTPDDKFESVRVRNNENLETVDINSYILPGQFRPVGTRKAFVRDKEYTIPGDGEVLLELKKHVDEFKPFSTGEGKGFINRFPSTEIEDFNTTRGLEPTPAPGRFGYLRNMLVNTKVIRSAFNASLGEGETIQPTEPINILESIENIFRDINSAGGLNYWNFQLKEDELEDGNIKIIDDATTHVDFSVPGKKETEFINNKIDGQPKVFYFPVWQSDSIVKRQNVTTKIPNSIQLSTMYGSNADLAAEFENHATTFDAVGVAAGGFTNGDNDKGLENVNIALKNDFSKGIGLKSGEETDNLTFTGGEDVLKFINENVLPTLEEAYSKVTDDIKERQKKEAELVGSQELKDLFDSSLPLPSTDFLSDTELDTIFSTTLNDSKLDESERDRIITAFTKSFGRKFLDGVVRDKFLGFINERIVGYGTSNNEDIPILIPFEIELDIDGIGGIYPANSFHSTYLPTRYQDAVIFQAKDVNHRVDDTGWTTTLSGVMRSTLNRVLLTNSDYKDLKEKYIKNYRGKILQELQKSQNEEAAEIKGQAETLAKYGKFGLTFVIAKKWLTNLFIPSTRKSNKKVDTGI